MNERSATLLQIWAATGTFALVHSAMATDKAKAYARAHLGWDARRYRLFYVLVSIGMAGLWLFFVQRLPDQPLYALDGLVRALLHVLQLAGVALFLWAVRSIDVPAFLGLKSLPDEQEPFVVQGAYQCTRHPMYAGALLVLFAQPVQSENHLHLSLAVALYLLVGAQLEERRMLRMHAGYAEYRRRTPFLWPRWTCLRRVWSSA